jgi:hypothetical protein
MRRSSIAAFLTLAAALIAALLCTASAGAADACPGDIDDDGLVGVVDLVDVVLNWGQCGVGPECPADLNRDGVVDVLDLIELVLSWGPCP